MKQEERRKKTIKRLLESAKALIKEKDCAEITMKDLTERSGLTKGAIFHYADSKDDIFIWVLEESVRDTDARFEARTQVGPAEFEGPFKEIVRNLSALQNAADPVNRVLVYLMGRGGNPGVAEALNRFYALWTGLAEQWIETGQRHGVIPAEVDARETAEGFVLMTLGLRVRSFLQPGDNVGFDAGTLEMFMRKLLGRPHSEQEGG